MKRKKKFYAVVSEDKSRLHGAFPFSPEGKLQAQDYIRILQKKSEDRFQIIEK